MAVATELSPADLYEWLLRVSDAADAVASEFGATQPAEFVVLRSELASLEETLQDILDNQAADAAMADVREHGAIPWIDVKKRLAL